MENSSYGTISLNDSVSHALDLDPMSGDDGLQNGTSVQLEPLAFQGDFAR